MIAYYAMIFIAFPLIAYVIASTPFGVIIARSQGIDLRQHGSGNVGATNVGRVVGKKWGYLCFALDVSKGLVPVLATGLFLQRGGQHPSTVEQLAWLLVGFATIMGHMLSFWLKFRGGKGVATSLGMVLGFWPYLTVAGLAGFTVWILVTLITRYVSVGSIVACAVLPVFFVIRCLVWGPSLMEVMPLLIFVATMAALVIYRHRSNMGRLLRGQESKIGPKRPAK